MELRPRCITCRLTGHTVCPVVIVPSSNVSQRVRRTTATVRRPKCCSFCGRSGHYKPRCDKYKIFVEEVKPFDADNFMIVIVDRLLKDMQNMFSRYLKSQFSSAQISQIFCFSDNGFKAVLQVFLHDFDEHVVQQQPQPEPEKITLKLSKTSVSKKHAECGICLADDIPCSKIVKLGCGHEFCGDCVEKLINAKPCCAFCRADIKDVSVASKTMQTKFKKNKKFIGKPTVSPIEVYN